MSIKMSAGGNSINPAKYIKQSLNDMNAAGAGQRSRVIMKAASTAGETATGAPVVSGSMNERVMEGF